MFKNSVKKLILIALCAIFVLPFINLSSSKVYADTAASAQKVYKGVVNEFELSEAISSKDVKISVKKEGEDQSKWVVLYENGEVKFTDGYTLTYSSNSKVNVAFYNEGSYNLKVEKKSDENSYTLAVEKNYEVGTGDDYIVLRYSYTQEQLEEYKTAVQNAVEDDFKAGDSKYDVPNILDLVETNFPNGSVKKTVYYLASGDTSYKTSSATKADLTFSINSYSSYRFYVLCSIEKSDENRTGGKAITVDGLKEFEDGFYQIYKDESKAEKLYFKSDKYYIDEEFETEYDGEVDEGNKELEVPIFTFELENKGPNVKITSTYQENGYVGRKYTVSSISVYGNVMREEYVLEYNSKNTADGWETVQTLEKSNLSFKPDKKGYYRVKVTAYDENPANAPVEAYTKNIKVSEKFVKVEYKTSFKDWLDVNLVPFILLCTSGACLIAIVLLLVVKPKQKEVQIKEEDR